ncbi:MAG: Re/Si-specific NAD(P)(+) transhydrogenase subunit alpha [bacterium]|nr:Re/Si-specific NAD(P)(+) transhydrogenase subunit alpha [bacterium]
MEENRIIIGIPKEKYLNETRVALVPKDVKTLSADFEVYVEKDAGINCGYSNEDYINSGAKIVDNVYNYCNFIFKVRKLLKEELNLIKPNSYIVGFLEPFNSNDLINYFLENDITSFSVELIPRISRAQNMDALSSMSTIAGYKAVLLAANYSIKMFPLLMTAAGTITPAKVLVIGAGVAGLQAIAISKKLGAIVDAFDPRPATKDQIKSVGGNYIDFSIENFEDKSGYAKEVDESIILKEREILKPYVVNSDVIITTAMIPGKKAPILITKDMVDQMKLGSVIVDLAAVSGGNCELTKTDEVFIYNNKTIIGYTNLPALMPLDASNLYSRNLLNLFKHLTKKSKEVKLDFNDEIEKEITLTYKKQIINPKLKELLTKK